MQAPVTSVLVRLEQPGSHGERKGGVIEDDGDEGPGALAGMFPAGADFGAGLDAEMAAIDRTRTGWERSALRADLGRALEDRKRVAIDSKGRAVLAKLRGMHIVLQEHLGNPGCS